MNTKCIGKNDVEFCRKQDNQFESTIPKISVNATVTEAPFFTFWLRAPTYPILFAIFLEGMMILGGFSPQLEEDIHISPSSDHLFSFAPGHFDYRRSRPSYKHLYNMCLKFEQRPCFEMVNLEIFFPIQTQVPRSNMKTRRSRPTLQCSSPRNSHFKQLNYHVLFPKFAIKNGKYIFRKLG